jgi:hypothetical protein
MSADRDTGDQNGQIVWSFALANEAPQRIQYVLLDLAYRLLPTGLQSRKQPVLSEFHIGRRVPSQGTRYRL